MKNVVLPHLVAVVFRLLSFFVQYLKYFAFLEHWTKRRHFRGSGDKNPLSQNTLSG